MEALSLAKDWTEVATTVDMHKAGYDPKPTPLQSFSDLLL